MRIGCSTITFGPQSTEEALQRIADLGFTVVDVAAVPGHFDHVQLVSPQPGEIARVAALVRKHGFEVAALQSAPWVPDVTGAPDADELRRRYTVAADAAQALGARAWVVVTNPGTGGAATRLQDLDRFRGDITMAAELAEGRGLRLAIEAPHRGTLAESLPEVIEVLNASNLPQLGIDLDTSHMLNSGASTREILDGIGRRIIHVALRDGHRGGAFCTPGDGDFDFADFFRQLQGSGYSGDATLELEPVQEDASAEDRAREASRARQYLEQLLADAGLS